MAKLKITCRGGHGQAQMAIVGHRIGVDFPLELTGPHGTMELGQPERLDACQNVWLPLRTLAMVEQGAETGICLA